MKPYRWLDAPPPAAQRIKGRRVEREAVRYLRAIGVLCKAIESAVPTAPQQKEGA